MIVAAKSLSLVLLEKHIERGVPKPAPKPPNRYERALLETFYDSEYLERSASPATKRQKIAQMKERHEKELGSRTEWLDRLKAESV